MSLSAILDVAIGLSFIYALLALVCSGINEYIAGLANLRARKLERAITALLGKGGAECFYKNPLITPLAKHRILGRGNQKPSYIGADLFAKAVLTGVAGQLPSRSDDDRGAVTDALSAAKESLPKGPMTTALTTLWASTDHRMDDLRAAVEGWFNAKMDRVSGEYRRQVAAILLVIGFVVAVGLNVDSIAVARVLWRDPALRSAVVNAAERAHLGASQTVTATLPAASSPESPTTAAAIVPATATAEDCASFATSTAGVAEALTCLDRLDLPIGWSRARGDPRRVTWGWNLVFHIIGWLITAIAVSLGAPFWFNLMGGLLRLAGDPPAAAPPTETPGGGGPGSAPPQPPGVVNVVPAGDPPTSSG